MIAGASCLVLITAMCFSRMLQFPHSDSGFSVHHSALRLIADVTDGTHHWMLYALIPWLYLAV